METFNITPVNERIYILSGNPASGKSFFAKTIKNAFVVDDIHMGMDHGIKSYVIMTLDYITKGVVPNIHGRTFSSLSLILFITNDIPTQMYIKEVVEEWLESQKRKKAVEDAHEARNIKNNQTFYNKTRT